MNPRTSATWDDLVTVALLGTDRRPLPVGLPAGWAGAEPDRPSDPAVAVLRLAARHRCAARAGSLLPTARPVELGAPADPASVPSADRSELVDSMVRGAAGPVNDELLVLVDAGGRLAPEHWTAAATLAARSPRVDRALLARALGVRGVWFVEQNPQWARLAATLRARLTDHAA